MILTSSAQREFSLGPWPLERAPRRGPLPGEAAVDPRNAPRADSLLGEALANYQALFRVSRDGDSAAARAPVPADPLRRARDIRGAGYFLDADMIGICKLGPACVSDADILRRHSHGIVVLVAHGRRPEPGNPARDWVGNAVPVAAAMRALMIANCLAAYIRQLGFSARAHDDSTGETNNAAMAVMAGLCLAEAGQLHNPWLDDRFELATVSTDYALVEDHPLAASARRGRNLAWWLGLGGAVSGLERRRRERRATHLSDYPMETVPRVDAPTTLILEDEVPRVPKRAAFFERALRGDLGEKARHERFRFAYKHPLSQAMVANIRAMVPHQDGPIAATRAAGSTDPAANARAVKSLAHLLGANLCGICEIPDYAWFSHREDGTPITPGHRYAVVMLIDQGYDTMEGASGDDWISGAQSMRAYMRGGEIAGIMAEVLRALGHPARSHTNVDSDLLHIPLILKAGLGELSRIGELVLNPFVGPRFKSVVLSTDLPLATDRPIDFGLQRFCEGCLKCARECPCEAIPFGNKVMFNGYEIWKPDVERCTRYRLTNQRGLGCGRCMKTCPLNKVVDLDGPLTTQLASWLGIHARWLKPALVPLATRLDDWLGHGVRNPHKKWWLDLEIVDGVCVHPRGVNERDIQPGKRIDIDRQKVACYPAALMPPADAGDNVWPVTRRDGLAAAASLETPAAARARRNMAPTSDRN